MDTETIISILKGLTLDFVNRLKNRKQTVAELLQRIDSKEIFDMPESVPEKEFITQVYVSLSALREEGCATSREEMEYYAEVFEGKRQFVQEEVRRFNVGPFENEK